MEYLLLTNLGICFGCFYLLEWNKFFNNEKNKLKFLAIFTLIANLPFVNVLLLIYLLLNKRNNYGSK